MKVVMVFGAFDGLHPGHLSFFKQAKKYGNFLIVSVGTNKNVERIKGQKPLFSELERLGLARDLSIVDQAVLGVEEDFYNEIKKYAPDVVCLGYDQWASEAEVKSELLKVGLTKTKVVRLRPYKNQRAKSTIVKSQSVDY